MDCKYCLSVYCMLISIWGIIQLYLMGLFYHMEAVPLVHDVLEHDHHATEKIKYADFIKKTEDNYRELFKKCMVGGTFYVLLLIVCIVSLLRIRKKEAKQRSLENDIDYVCKTMKSKAEVEILSKEDRKRRDRELKEFNKSLKPLKEKGKGKKKGKPDKQLIPTIEKAFEDRTREKSKDETPKEDKPDKPEPKEKGKKKGIKI